MFRYIISYLDLQYDYKKLTRVIFLICFPDTMSCRYHRTTYFFQFYLFKYLGDAIKKIS